MPLADHSRDVGLCPEVVKQVKKGGVWEHVFVSVPPARAARRLPESVEALGVRLHISGPPQPSPLVLGVRAARYPASWARRSLRGAAYVELRPASSHGVEAVLHLAPPATIRGRLLWTARWSRCAASALATELRSNMEVARLRAVLRDDARAGSPRRKESAESPAAP